MMRLSGNYEKNIDKAVNSICDELDLQVKEVFKYKIGKGDQIVSKYSGNKKTLDNDLLCDIL